MGDAQSPASTLGNPIVDPRLRAGSTPLPFILMQQSPSSYEPLPHQSYMVPVIYHAVLAQPLQATSVSSQTLGTKPLNAARLERGG